MPYIAFLVFRLFFYSAASPLLSREPAMTIEENESGVAGRPKAISHFNFSIVEVPWKKFGRAENRETDPSIHPLPRLLRRDPRLGSRLAFHLPRP